MTFSEPLWNRLFNWCWLFNFSWFSVPFWCFFQEKHCIFNSPLVFRPINSRTLSFEHFPDAKKVIFEIKNFHRCFVQKFVRKKILCFGLNFSFYDWFTEIVFRFHQFWFKTNSVSSETCSKLQFYRSWLQF